MAVDSGEVKVSAQEINTEDSMMQIGDSSAMASGLYVTEEEEASRVIEMLRGEDLSARITAANQLDSVAAALGEERTRDVRKDYNLITCAILYSVDFSRICHTILSRLVCCSLSNRILLIRLT